MDCLPLCKLGNFGIFGDLLMKYLASTERKPSLAWCSKPGVERSATSPSYARTHSAHPALL